MIQVHLQWLLCLKGFTVLLEGAAAVSPLTTESQMDVCGNPQDCCSPLQQNTVKCRTEGKLQGKQQRNLDNTMLITFYLYKWPGGTYIKTSLASQTCLCLTCSAVCARHTGSDGSAELGLWHYSCIHGWEPSVMLWTTPFLLSTGQLQKSISSCLSYINHILLSNNFTVRKRKSVFCLLHNDGTEKVNWLVNTNESA